MNVWYFNLSMLIRRAAVADTKDFDVITAICEVMQRHQKLHLKVIEAAEFIKTRRCSVARVEADGETFEITVRRVS
jgi:hypothetical protein